VSTYAKLLLGFQQWSLNSEYLRQAPAGVSIEELNSDWNLAALAGTRSPTKANFSKLTLDLGLECSLPNLSGWPPSNKLPKGALMFQLVQEGRPG